MTGDRYVRHCRPALLQGKLKAGQLPHVKHYEAHFLLYCLVCYSALLLVLSLLMAPTLVLCCRCSAPSIWQLFLDTSASLHQAPPVYQEGCRLNAHHNTTFWSANGQ